MPLLSPTLSVLRSTGRQGEARGESPGETEPLVLRERERLAEEVLGGKRRAPRSTEGRRALAWLAAQPRAGASPAGSAREFTTSAVGRGGVARLWMCTVEEPKDEGRSA